jgi:hypothetical protein
MIIRSRMIKSHVNTKSVTQEMSRAMVGSRFARSSGIIYDIKNEIDEIPRINHFQRICSIFSIFMLRKPINLLRINVETTTPMTSKSMKIFWMPSISETRTKIKCIPL